jgi:hypothetical protein
MVALAMALALALARSSATKDVASSGSLKSGANNGITVMQTLGILIQAAKTSSFFK